MRNAIVSVFTCWRRSHVILQPDLPDPSFKPLVLENLNDSDVRIVAELVEVL